MSTQQEHQKREPIELAYECGRTNLTLSYSELFNPLNQLATLFNTMPGEYKTGKLTIRHKGMMVKELQANGDYHWLEKAARESVHEYAAENGIRTGGRPILDNQGREYLPFAECKPLEQPAQSVGGGSLQMDNSPLERQVGGNHYKRYAIQPVEYIEQNGLGFLEGCIIKRITRWREKDGFIDLEKIIHEVQLLIEQEKKKRAKNAA